jgi:hypothetical protein
MHFKSFFVLMKVQNMSTGRQEAFEIFKRDYVGNHEIEEQKRFLKKSYAEAKMLGELINKGRSKLSNKKEGFLDHIVSIYKTI